MIAKVWWVVVVADVKCIAFGPYPNLEAANLASYESLIIEDAVSSSDYITEDIQVVVTHAEDSPEDAEIVLIDLKNPHHTG